MSETDSWYDAELSDDEKEIIADAGASGAFLSVIEVDPGVVGVGRNSARQEAKKLLRLFEADDPEALDDRRKVSGDFFNKLWDGEIAGALCHADGNNSRILTQKLDPERIIDHGVSEENFAERNLRNIVAERVKRYGPDDVDVRTLA